MLDLKAVSITGGGKTLLMNANLRVDDGEITAVFGRNGTGKTTLLRSIMGLNREGISAGEIWVNGIRVDHMDAHRVARQGIGYAAQKRGLFLKLTIEDNLRVGTGRFNPEILGELLERFPAVGDRVRRKGETLSGGERQQVKLVRAITRARCLLLLDEISAGVNKELFPRFAAVIREAAERSKMPVLLVEQNRKFAKMVADQTYELASGDFSPLRKDRDQVSQLTSATVATEQKE